MFYPREEQNAHYLKPRTTSKKTFYTPWADYFSKALNTSLDSRPKSADSDQLKELQKTFTTGIPLEQKAFVAFMDNMESLLEKITAGNEEGSYSVSNSEYDRSTLDLDAYHKEMNNEILKQVRSSPNIQEAFRLLDNVITGKK